MNWTIVIVIAAAVFFFTACRTKQISEAAASTFLKQDAVVIDVRTTGEFNSGHLAKALNIPLSEVTTEIPKRFSDKSKVLLVHCRSGHRSGIAEKQLRSLGYTNVFNLGSYGRAESILSGQN